MDQQKIRANEKATTSVLGLLEIGIQRLLGRYPLFGGLVATWNVVADGTIKTMAVGFGNFGFNLYFNSDFVRKISIDQLVGVLHHEACHIVYGHLWMDPKDYPDDKALVIAQEITVNEGIPEPLPERPMLLKNFPNLKPSEDTETRYHRLAKRKISQETKGAGQAGVSERKIENGKTDKGSDATGTAKARSKGPAKDPAPSDPHDGNTIEAPDNAGTTRDDDHGAAITPNAKPSKLQNAPASSGEVGTEMPEGKEAVGAAGSAGSSDNNVAAGGHQTNIRRSESCKRDNKQSESNGNEAAVSIDDHSRWHEVRARESFSKTILGSIIQKILDTSPPLTPGETAALAHAEQNWGYASKPIFTKGKIEMRPGRNWRILLRKYVGELFERSPTLSRPPRRFPKLVGVIPGKANNYGKPKILAVIDTSASMVFEQFAVCNEIARMAKHYDVWWVECDSAGVRTVYKWGGPKLKAVEGGGGSALQPAFDRAFLRKHKPDLVVFFTIGNSSLSLKAPHFPVIWVLTPDGKRPAPWGRVIRMQETHPKFEDLGSKFEVK